VHERQTSGLIGPPNNLEAQKMLDAVTSGDRSALINLYMSNYGYLAQFLSQFIGSDSGVGDVINDTFMSIWKTARPRPLRLRV
jgi:DNA-directed RNA polymerase specialized sigma24 family protein